MTSARNDAIKSEMFTQTNKQSQCSCQRGVPDDPAPDQPAQHSRRHPTRQRSPIHE